MTPLISIRDAAPPDAIGDTPEAFLRWLGGPTLLHLRRPGATRTRAAVTLLHGNEPSGTRAVHRWLRGGAPARTNAVIFLGAVEEALGPPPWRHRHLEGRRDLNRCFRPPWDGREGAIARELLQIFDRLGCESVIDLHNNTGHNPAYGLGIVADETHLGLVALFGERFVRYDLRVGALMEATEPRRPTVTIECGRAGDPLADDVAWRGLTRYLDIEELPRYRGDAPMDVLVHPVRVNVRADVSLAFGDAPVAGADLTLANDVDRHNFQRLPAGSPVGWTTRSAPLPVEARGGDGADIAASLFTVHDGMLALKGAATPIMITTDPTVARSDCLFYLVTPRV